MKDHPSFEYHKFEKLDATNADHRKLFEDYWMKLTDDVDVVEGLTCRTVKYFK